mgnify:CR=1 FL=1
MNSVQRQLDQQYGNGSYSTVVAQQGRKDLPAAFVQPQADSACRCAQDGTTAPGFVRLDNRVRLCGRCALGRWRAFGMQLEAAP